MADPSPQAPESNGEQPSNLLLKLVHEELRAMAAAKMAEQDAGQTLQPTVLVHGAWLRLKHGEQKWESRGQFYRSAAVAMRRILTDRARQKPSLTRSGGRLREDPGPLDPAAVEPGEHLLLVDEGLKRLEGDDPESAEIVMLKFFSGLSDKDAALTLGISEFAVEGRWAFAKVRLMRIMRELADGPRPKEDNATPTMPMRDP